MNRILSFSFKTVCSMAYYTEIECDAFDPFYHTEEQLRSDVNSGPFESLVEPVSKWDIDTSLVKIIVIDEMDYTAFQACGDLFKATLATLLHPGSYNLLYANEEENEFNVTNQKVTKSSTDVNTGSSSSIDGSNNSKQGRNQD
ncbi:hypothetical protein Tco_0999360 [Tanacetum coccineum]